MLLKNLLPDYTNFNLTSQDLNKKISSIEIDSRKVKIDSIFFALRGLTSNGVDFIDQAIKKGAKVIICDIHSNINIDLDLNQISIIKTANPHQLLIDMLKAFYHDLPKNIFAVTGTNGKTSVAQFCHEILQILGKKSATIGTLGIVCQDDDIKDKFVGSSLTSPDIVTFYQNLAILKAHNIDFVILEASSIGLEQGRIDGIAANVGIFTNFSQDHLDYHQNMENYFQAKMILFNNILKSGSLAILNSDDNKFSDLVNIAQNNDLKIIDYGFKAQDFVLKNIVKKDNFSKVNIKILEKEYSFETNLIEEFQIINLLCALAAIASYLKLDDKIIEYLLNKLDNIRIACGRMEQIAILKNNAKIYIDFAHSPDALQNILQSARKISKSKLIVLFGCGGNRDAAKRPLMGRVADNFADIIIITDDNPRNEDRDQIRKDIILGINNKEKLIEVADRKLAIKKAISLLSNDDILILAGKGHEKYQIIGDKKIEFDENIIVRNLLK